jgi:endo-1,4-beta-xylanase
MFRGWLLAGVVAGLSSCTADSSPQPAEGTETTSSALTGTLSYDFEDGQVLPWKPFGSPTLTNTTEQANNGTHSLKTTNRTSGFMGPSLELSGQLNAGAIYKIQTAVRLGPGETLTTVKMTVMRTPTGQSSVFEPVSGASNSNVTADGWVTLSGTYSFTGTVTGLLLYVESASATASYYIDDVSIVQTTAPALSFDFENGQVLPWTPFGSPTLQNVTEQALGGTHSLKVTTRTASFMGPGLDVKTQITKGFTYAVSVSARLVTGEPTTNVLATFSRTPTGGTGTFDTPLTLSNVTDQGWMTGSALYVSPTDNQSLTFFIQTANGNTSSFYVDNITITQVAGLPGPPGNTAGASATFESNTTEGWKPRIGRETLTPTQADAHGGSFSLLTTGRQAAFDGPAFDVTNVMFNGSRYVVSVWAKLAPGQADSQLRVSLQRNAGSVTSFHTVVGNTTVTANAWVRLQATYDDALANTSLTMYVETNSGTASFYIDDFSITYVQPAVAERDIPSVWQSMTKDFPIVGAAVIPADINGSEPAFLLSKHFNSITSGNDMKWDATEATENVFTFGQADAEVAFAKANNMHVRGHTLVWHNQIPAWVFTDPATGQPMQPSDANRTILIQRMQNHITTVMKHFDGDVPTWDVVNEPFDQSQPDGLRRSPWYNIIGPEYIDIALQAARAAQPNAKLYINDFDSTNPPRRDFIVSKLRDLKTRNIPVDGFGHQMHNNIEYPPVQTIVDAINMVATTGVEQSVTELDYSIYSGSFPTPFTVYTDIPASRHNMVGYSYFNFLQALRQVPGKIVSLTIWGTSDDKSWLNSSTKLDAPLLFDPSLKKKPAYWAFVDPLQLPGANLVTTLAAAPTTTVPAGQGVAYTITVTNQADVNQPSFAPTDDDLPAANVVMTMNTPSHTSFQGLTPPTGWACTSPLQGTTGQIRCTIPSLAAAASALFTVTVAVNDCSTPDGTFITAAAGATSTTANPNPTPQNNAPPVSVQLSNPPPVITANGPLSVTAECHTSYTDQSAKAVDACEGPVPFTTTSTVDVNTVGSYTVTYTAQDSAQNPATPVVRSVAVVDTTAPVVTVLGPNPMTVECATGFTDPSATASDSCVGTLPTTVTGTVNPNVVGGYGLSYTATDPSGNTGSAARAVAVTDTTPPQLGVLATAPLTPPDHRYVSFPVASLAAAASDTCDATVGIGSVVITQATSDEPDNGNGDGNTTNDIVIAADCRSVQLRAERAGPLNGRVYHVTLRVTDASGNSTIKVATVTVPKDDVAVPAIDDGPLLTVVSACH